MMADLTAIPLPQGWGITTLENVICKDGIISDGDWVESKDQDPAGDVRLVQLADIGDGTFLNKSSRFLNYQRAVALRCTFLCPGDLLISRLGEPLGKSCIFPDIRAQSVTAVDVLILRSGLEAATQKWLMYCINSPFIRAVIAEQQSGTTRKRITGNKIKELPVRFPPLSEQARIVSRIEELFSDLDTGEENLRRAQAQLKRYRQSVLKAAVTGELTRAWREQNGDKLESGEALLKRILKARREAWEQAELEKLCAKGKRPKDDAWKARYVEPQVPDTEGLPELPRGWAWASLDQLSWDSCYGTSAKCSYEGQGIGVLRIPNIRFGRISEEDIKFSIIPLDVAPAELLLPGDLLIIRTNGSEEIVGTGAVVLVPLRQPYYFASYAIRFRLVLPDVISRYANLYLGTEIARSYIRRIKATSAGQYNVSQTNLTKMPVALPPIAELPEVISLCEASLSSADAIEVTLKTGLMQSAALRQSILKAAFSGKLVAQDPNDEPASELLQRIAAERAAQSARPTRSAAPRAPRKACAAAQPSASAPAAAPVAVSGLAAARKAAGLSQAQLAAAIGINQAYVSQMETGKRVMTADQAAAIAKALGVEPSVLTQE